MSDLDQSEAWGELQQYEAIARAMSRWSSGLKPWDLRHPKTQRHWLLVAEAVMSHDSAIYGPILERVRARKAELDAAPPEPPVGANADQLTPRGRSGV